MQNRNRILDRQTDRDPAIDYFKFISALLVIAIHTDILAGVSDIANFVFLQGVARISVPFFIVCTGFYIGKKITIDSGKVINIKQTRISILHNAWKIFRLYLICSVCYLIIQVPNWISEQSFSLLNWIKDFFLYGSYYHLWYLIEVCYALLVLAILVPILKRPYIYILTAVLWIIEVLDYDYIFALPPGLQSVFSQLDKYQLPFESIIRALPLLLLGIIIQKSNTRRIQYYSIGLVISAVFLGVEIYFVKTYGLQKYGYLLFTLPLEYYLFQIILYLNKKCKCHNTVMISKISTFMYCAHPAFILLVNSLFDCPHWLLFIIVSIISVTTGYLYYSIIERIVQMKKDH